MTECLSEFDWWFLVGNIGQIDGENCLFLFKHCFYTLQKVKESLYRGREAVSEWVGGWVSKSVSVNECE